MPTLHALFVGVNDYEDREISSLICAAPDADGLREFFRQRLHRVLVADTPGTPSSAGLWRQLATLRQRVQPGDRLLVYFAGHSVLHRGQQYLLFPEVRKASLVRGQFNQGAIAFTELRDWIRTHLRVPLLLVLDTCRRPLSTDPQAQALHDAAGRSDARSVPSRLEPRNVVKSRRLTSAADWPPIMGRPVHAFSEGLDADGLLISACSDDQNAYGLRDRQRGLFSEAFEDAIRSDLDAGHTVVDITPDWLAGVTRRMQAAAPEADQTPFAQGAMRWRLWAPQAQAAQPTAVAPEREPVAAMAPPAPDKQPAAASTCVASPPAAPKRRWWQFDPIDSQERLAYRARLAQIKMNGG